MASSFTGAQFLTAMMWGKISDSDRGGRKLVLLIGLSGTAVSCLGFGFAKTFWQAILFRTMGGALNGNIGVMRTMVSEIVQEKKYGHRRSLPRSYLLIDTRYQSRAFLLFPMCFNIGIIIGPVLGGLLADPAGSYPGTFGHVAFLRRFPYAPPNILSALFLFSATLGVFFGLREVCCPGPFYLPGCLYKADSRIFAAQRRSWNKMCAKDRGNIMQTTISRKFTCLHGCVRRREFFSSAGR